jgi:hypothetical protein
MAEHDELDVARIAGAIGGLKAVGAGLAQTTASGFAGINRRLDHQNGRLRHVEKTATTLTAKMMTTKMCEGFRSRCAAARAAGWRSFVIPTGVGLLVALGTVLIARLAG